MHELVQDLDGSCDDVRNDVVSNVAGRNAAVGGFDDLAR
jgi:hypothetical protein